MSERLTIGERGMIAYLMVRPRVWDSLTPQSQKYAALLIERGLAERRGLYVAATEKGDGRDA